MKDKFILSIKWNIIGSIFKIILQFGSTIVLTRILLPSDFGLLAIALSIVIFGNMINDFGLSQALIQKKDIGNHDIRYVFTIQMSFAILITLFVFLTSPFLADYFHNPEIEFILNVMSFMFIIQAFGLTSASLLRRSMDFKKIQIAQLIAYLVSYGFIAIPMAYMSFGVWSLVMAQLMQSFLTAIIVYAMQRHNVVPLYRYKEQSYILKFGGKSIINNIINWAIVNIDVFLIGHFLGVKSLGYYNRANALFAMPTGVVVGSVKGVLFSLYSKMQDDIEFLTKIYLGSITAMGYAIIPLILTIALVPKTIVLVLFGSNWIFLSELIPPLAIAIIIQIFAGMGGPLTWGKNKGEKEVIAQFYALVILSVSLFFTSQISLVYASWGVAFAFCFRLYFVNTVALKILHLSWLEYGKSIYKPLILSAIIATGTMIFDKFIFTNMNVYLVFFFDVLFASMILSILLYRYMKYFISDELIFLLEKEQEKLPDFVKKKLFNEGNQK
jgi:O-antigen/teichoic acid export membrane protein